MGTLTPLHGSRLARYHSVKRSCVPIQVFTGSYTTLSSCTGPVILRTWRLSAGCLGDDKVTWQVHYSNPPKRSVSGDYRRFNASERHVSCELQVPVIYMQLFGSFAL